MPRTVRPVTADVCADTALPITLPFVAVRARYRTAGGTVGTKIGARTTPDGYTISEGSMGLVAVDVSLHGKLPYDPIRNFVPIARAD